MNDDCVEFIEGDHKWGQGWEESDRPHPGFGGTMDLYGGYVCQCMECGMYYHEYNNSICGTQQPGKYEGHNCDQKIR